MTENDSFSENYMRNETTDLVSISSKNQELKDNNNHSYSGLMTDSVIDSVFSDLHILKKFTAHIKLSCNELQ